MEITQERTKAVWGALKLLVEACNMVTEDELDALLQEGERKQAIDPMLDPTKYRAEGQGHYIRQTQKVLRAFKVFKQEVKGIGSFN